MVRRTRTVPRKNPTQDRAKGTVNAILEATARILVKDGYDRASTNRVAEEAGVSVGSLYQYFPSKEALVAALVDRHIQETMGQLEGIALELMHQPIEVAARKIVEALLASHRVNPDLQRVLRDEVPRVGRLQRIEDLETRSRVLLRAYLEVHRDAVRPSNLDAAAFILAELIEGVTHGAVLRGRFDDDEVLVAETTEMIINYLRKRSG